MADSELVSIHWTCGNLDEARKVARYLVQERLVAAAQITPWTESIFMSDNKLDVEQETSVSFRTRRDLFEKICEVILSNCKYELPEIIVVPIEGGHSEYLQWIRDSTPDFATSSGQ